jgi:hypothetical protein
MTREELAKRLMRRLCAFPSFHPSKNPDTAEAYTLAIAKLLQEFGSEKTYEAITAAIESGGQFPPSAGDLRIFVRIAASKSVVASADTEVERENERLKELLTYYGDHQRQCGAVIGQPPCTCGWAKVLAALLGDEDAAAVENFRASLDREIANGTTSVVLEKLEEPAR